MKRQVVLPYSYPNPPPQGATAPRPFAGGLRLPVTHGRKKDTYD